MTEISKNTESLGISVFRYFRISVFRYFHNTKNLVLRLRVGARAPQTFTFTCPPLPVSPTVLFPLYAPTTTLDGAAGVAGMSGGRHGIARCFQSAQIVSLPR